eukprot:scaffold7802_cov15-Tisochrysis_lutea.AAC.1
MDTLSRASKWAGRAGGRGEHTGGHEGMKGPAGRHTDTQQAWGKLGRKAQQAWTRSAGDTQQPWRSPAGMEMCSQAWKPPAALEEFGRGSSAGMETRSTAPRQAGKARGHGVHGGQAHGHGETWHMVCRQAWRYAAGQVGTEGTGGCKSVTVSWARCVAPKALSARLNLNLLAALK